MPSRRLGAYLLASHCAALVVAFSLPLDWYWRVGVATLVLAGFVYAIGVHLLYRAFWAVREATWSGDGTWTLTLVSGEEIDARLSPSTYVTGRLLVLSFRHGRWRTRSLVLFPDALDSNLLRRLRVRLRLAGAQGAEGTDPLA